MKKEINSWVKKTIKDISAAALLPPTVFKIVWSKKPNNKNSDIEAAIQYYPEKKTTKLIIYPKFIYYWNRGKKDYLKEILIHELMHIHTAEIHRMALSDGYTPEEVEDAIERLTCVVSKYIKEIIKRGIKIRKISFYDFGSKDG